jgi:type II secretory pathway component PulF
MKARSDQIASLPASSLPPDVDYWRSLRFALIVVAIHACLIVSHLIATLYFGARCDRTYRDFNLKLDINSQLVITAIHWLQNYWYVVVIMLFPAVAVDGGIVFVLNLSPRTRRWGDRWAIGVVILWMFLAAYTALSLYMPYQRLLEGLRR